MENEISSKNKSIGSVVSIRGSVVDIRFEKNLPSINSVVKTGKNLEVILETQNAARQ